MYLYLYDSFLNNKKYSGSLARIETRLTDLGIGGKISRLSPLRDLKELAAEEIGNGVKTVVVVGNDKTLSEVVNVVAKYNVTVGLIPLGSNNNIAKIFGIPSGEKACDVLAARIVEKIDLGKINNSYFVSGIEIKSSKASIECEGLYKINLNKDANVIGIYNLQPLLETSISKKSYFNPKDGMLEVFIQPSESRMFGWRKTKQKESIIPFKQLVIRGKNVSVITDGQKILKAPVTIESVSKKLKIIVGKNRVF